MASTNFQQGTVIASSWLNDVNALVYLGLFPGILPTYADNAAAVAGGLQVNQLYKTATGELRIVV